MRKTPELVAAAISAAYTAWVASTSRASTTHATGESFERAAARFLARRGYTVLAHNWRCPGGEIDLVARDGDTLVFVEVRARSSRAGYLPEETIGRAKVRRLALAGEAYLQSCGWQGPCRFDVVAIAIQDAGPNIRLIADAFQL